MTLLVSYNWIRCFVHSDLKMITATHYTRNLRLTAARARKKIGRRIGRDHVPTDFNSRRASVFFFVHFIRKLT